MEFVFHFFIFYPVVMPEGERKMNLSRIKNPSDLVSFCVQQN